VACATLAQVPVLKGDWLKPGTHVDLVGAYSATTREADDEVMRRGRLFVDCFDTTKEHIGEVLIPLTNGVISEGDLEGDLFDLCCGRIAPRQGSDITVFKNGGGAHLDLITARLIYERVTTANAAL